MNIDFNKYFNLSKLTKEQQTLLVGSITDLVLARLADLVGEHLSEQEISELEALSQKNNNSDAMIDWLNNHIPNLSQGIDEILKEEAETISLQLAALTNLSLREQSGAQS